MPISPFLELDEERRKRDQMFSQRLGNVGSSLVAAPLTYDKLMKDAEDRKTKLESDRIKLQQAKEEHELNQESGKLGMEATELGMSNTKQNMATEDETNRVKKLNPAVKAVVGAGLGRNLTDQNIIKESFDNPDLGELTDQSYVEAEIKSQRDAAAQQKLDNDLKQQAIDVRKKDSETREKKLNKIKNAGIKYKDLPVAAQNKLEVIRQDREGLANLMSKRGSIDTGLVSTLMSTLRRWTKSPEKDRAVYDQEAQRIFNRIVKNQSGATVTAQEMTRQMNAFPDTWTEEEVYDAMLIGMADALENSEDVILDMYSSMPNYKSTADAIRSTRKPLPSQKAKVTEESINAMTPEQQDARIAELEAKKGKK